MVSNQRKITASFFSLFISNQGKREQHRIQQKIRKKGTKTI